MKDVRGNESKNKRRIAIALVLIALVFVAVMLLHRHGEPKIIGKLSQEEATEISNVSLKSVRMRLKLSMKIGLKTFKASNMQLLARYAKYYAFGKVISIRVREPGTYMVLIGTRKDQIFWRLNA